MISGTWNGVRYGVTIVAVTGALVLSATAQDPGEKLRNERAAIARLRELGGRLTFEDRRVVSVDLTRAKDLSAAIDQLVHLPKIARLDLAGGTADPEGFEKISRLEHLERLNLAGAKVDDEGLVRLKSDSLNFLDLSETDVSDTGLEDVSVSLPRLQALNLTKTRCADPALAAVSKLAELRLLSLQGTKISDEGLAVFKDGPATLEALDLSDTPCSNAGLPHLTRLANLRALNLNGTTVTDAGIEPLRRLSRLENLTIERTRATAVGVIFLRFERDRLSGKNHPKPPEQTMSLQWTSGRLGQGAGEDKIVFLGRRLRDLPGGAAPLCLNTTRFAILFAGILRPGGGWYVTWVPYGTGGQAPTPWNLANTSVGVGACEYSITAFDDHLDIKIKAPGQAPHLLLRDRGDTLVVNGTQKFDLRYKKKYILVEANGKAREL